jgi:hypothetical protein
MIICCGGTTSIPPVPTITIITTISQVIIALSNLLLACYIFFYQRTKDRNAVELQWFKELLIEPNIERINDFYFNLHDTVSPIRETSISVNELQEINTNIKKELSDLKKSFIDMLMLVDRNFGKKIETNVETLIDNLTTAIFNEELKLNHPNVFNKEFTTIINYSKNNLFALIYGYKGRK